MDLVLSILTTIALLIAVLIMLVREYKANFCDKKNVLYLVGMAVCFGMLLAWTMSDIAESLLLAVGRG